MRWTTSSSTAVYYHRNQQYSVTALTDSSGAVLERYAYTAYGVPTIANASGGVLNSSAQNNRYTYTGREWDNDIQQYHYRARMYDPALGRFCSRDPIGYGGGNCLYLYVDARPASSMDSLGLFARRPPRISQNLPGHQQHHLYPQQHRIAIEGLCPGLLIDTYTFEVQGGTWGGSEHYHWQYGPCGHYNNDVAGMLSRHPENCCEFLRELHEYINNRAACVARQLAFQQFVRLQLNHGRSSISKQLDPSAREDEHCDEDDCDDEVRIPENPHVNVLPWWVPEKVENDIYQDAGVVVGCVVVGVVAGHLIVRCCPVGQYLFQDLSTIASFEKFQ